MKRMMAVALAAILAFSTLSGCYGKFNLTRKIYHANGEISDKFLRSGATWVMVIIPIYGVAALVDFVLFNTIEFWSGTNPVALGEKDFQYAKGEENFRVHATKNGDTISYNIRHFNKEGLMDTTQINWNRNTGRSTITTNANGEAKQFITSIDGNSYRVDQYAGARIEKIIFYKAGADGNLQLAAIRQ